jgi:hypothetical protein
MEAQVAQNINTKLFSDVSHITNIFSSGTGKLHITVSY